MKYLSSAFLVIAAVSCLQYITIKKENSLLNSEARLLRDEIADLRFIISSQPTYEQGYHDGILRHSDVEAYTRGYHFASGDK